MKAELRKGETKGMRLEGEEESKKERKKERKWKREEQDTRMVEVGGIGRRR